MEKLLFSEEETLDAMDAGTTMRFLTAYLAATNKNKIITGSKRMCERPIGLLVNALRDLGAEIEYTGKEGYPPLHIKAFKSQKTKNIQIQGNVSSQFISALLMVAPRLPEGLELHLEGGISSLPYIEMTLQMMKGFGVTYQFRKNVVTIAPQEYKKHDYEIEADWSGASYWYAMVALAEEGEVKLLGLRESSLQGDWQIAPIMDKLGVASVFHSGGVLLTKKESVDNIAIDFKAYPDLAQTIAVICAAKGVKATFTGLESLRIKETDRIAALQHELQKFGAKLTETNSTWDLIPATDEFPGHINVKTYDDHRMAMAFAPLVMLGDVTIEDPGVVNKSYPGFWDDLQKAGVKMEGRYS